MVDSIKFLLKATKAAPSFTSCHIWEHAKKDIYITDQIGDPFVREKTNSLFRYSGPSLLEFFCFPRCIFPTCWWENQLIPSSGKFHATPKFFVLMLPHFFSAFLYDTCHSCSFTFRTRKMFTVTVALLVESKTCVPKDGRQFLTTITGFELVSRNLS